MTMLHFHQLSPKFIPVNNFCPSFLLSNFHSQSQTNKQNSNNKQNRLAVASNAFLSGGRPAPSAPGPGAAAGLHSRQTPGRRLPLFIPPWCRSINITHTYIYMYTYIKVCSFGLVWWFVSASLISFALKTKWPVLDGVRFLVLFMPGGWVVEGCLFTGVLILLIYRIVNAFEENTFT